MRLSKRIYAIAEKVQPGESAADIGTDHGYVPMLLIKNNISPEVIMSDISSGSLAKAVETFDLCGLTVPAENFRTGNGLETIREGEVDDIIIGGLGGNTITDILAADESKSRSFRKLILQPRKHSGNLRYYLYTHGWDIISEDLAREGKFICEIITAVPSGQVVREPLYPENDIRWKYPEAIVKAAPELAADRLSWKTGSIQEELDNLSKSTKDHSDLIRRLRSDLEYLRSLESLAAQLNIK